MALRSAMDKRRVKMVMFIAGMVVGGFISSLVLILLMAAKPEKKNNKGSRKK